MGFKVLIADAALGDLMKNNITKRRYKAQKRSACAMCKPVQRGWEDKKTVRDVRVAIQHEQELKEHLSI